MEESEQTPTDKGKQLDQFFTKDSVASDCLSLLLDYLGSNSKYSIDSTLFLEPSAGGGAFLRALDKKNIKAIYACDLDPGYKGIVKRDFLLDDLSQELPDKEQVIIIGNPPFGRRARMAAEFINKGFKYADTVAFVLPLQFQKYSAQNKIIKQARLVLDEKLEPNSFVFNGKDYVVRCCFQIWTIKNIGRDLRLRTSPITKHPDFEMWQYNNTPEAEKYFDKQTYGWDFAIPRQGYKDYTLKEVDPDKMDRRTQWIFFKANNEEVYKRLLSIDYEGLSKKNISIPGFGKADVIKEYERLYGRINSQSSLLNNYI